MHGIRRTRGRAVVKGHLLEKVTFKQSPEGGESGKPGGNPGMGNSECKGLEAGQFLASLRKSEDVPWLEKREAIKSLE